MITRREALKLGKETLKTANARRDAEVLLMHLLRESRAELYRNMDKEVPALLLSRYRELLARRLKGHPIQYLTGYREFMGLDFMVTKDVLIPRPETEILVELAMDLIQNKIKAADKKNDIPLITAVDLGTGCGVIAISLAKFLAGIMIYALDVSRAALAVARENARLQGVSDRITFLGGDFLTPLNAKSNYAGIDFLLSNPPYIPSEELAKLSPQVRNFEPHQALDGGGDGLDFYRRIASEAPSYLRPGGWLVVEIGQGQMATVEEILEGSGIFTSFQVAPDLAGIPRVIAAKRGDQ